MPTFSEAAATIRTRFATELHAARDILIAFDNVAGLYDGGGVTHTEPKDTSGNPVPWVRLNTRPGDAFQVSLGKNRTFRHPGTVIVQIFTISGTGDGLAQQIADDVAAALRGVTVDGVRFKATSPPQYVGPDGPWYQVNCVTPFEYDDTV